MLTVFVVNENARNNLSIKTFSVSLRKNIMKPKRNINKKCCVCGDNASGLNYGVLTFESCKIFFFRNETKNFQCLKQNQCAIDVSSRKSCTKCRLEKCFTVGMYKTSSKLSDDCFNSLRSILLLDQNNDDHINKKKIKFAKPRSNPFELTQPERDQITQVQEAISISFEDETKMEVIAEVSNFVAIGQLHWPDLYARKVVKFCKNIPAFKLLDKKDQLIILRSSVFEILLVRCSYMFDPEKNGYPIIENEQSRHAIFVRLRNGLTSKYQIFKQNKNKLIFFLHQEMANDPVIRDLLSVLILFRSHENVSCPEFVRYQCILYHKLLRRYLASKCLNRNLEKRKFNRITNLLDYLLDFKERFMSKFQLENRFSMPEVLLEVLNFA